MFLGIDIGTSGVKAVAIDEHGAVVDQGHAALTVQRPHSGWSEQDPEVWWTATRSAVLGISASVRRAVQAIGLAGQMHGATVLDASDRPLRPAILWNDGRSVKECAQLEAAVPNMRRITGNIAMPGFTAPKLLWLNEHEPELFANIATVLLPKDYIRLRMTGEKISDMSDAAGTLWLDTKARCWSDTMLAATGLSREQMPSLVEGTDISGMLHPAIAGQWGMASVPVAGGAGDNAAGALGVGVVEDGDSLLSLGTSGVIFVANRQFSPNPDSAVHAFCHCLPDMWHQMSVHLSAASCLDWVAKLMRISSVSQLVELAENCPAEGGPEVFLPYLSGERTPHNDADVRGAFLYLDNDTNSERLALSVLEGVAFALADGLDALRAAGSQVSQLSVVGGGARSTLWGAILASALDVDLHYLKGGEVGPALGAAHLGRMALEGPDALPKPPPLFQTIRPDHQLSDRMAPKRARFKAAYPAITSRMKT